MVRWEPGARERLQTAALELFATRGFEQTTAAEIAQAVGLTERTFFRHFSDKREVLFYGQQEFLQAFIDGVDAAPPDASPLEVIASALQAAASFFPDERRPYSRLRQSVIDQNPALRERELHKLAGLATTVAEALRARGIGEPAATLAAQSGATVFGIAFAQWIRDGERRSLSDIASDVLHELLNLTGAATGSRAPELSRRSRAGGVPDDQLGGQLDVQGLELLALHEPDKKTDGEAAHFLQWLTHGCEQGAGGLSQVDVVETGDGEFFGYAQSTPGGRGQSTHGDLVVEPDQRGRPLGQVKQFAGGVVAELRGGLAATDQLGVRQHTDIRQRRRVSSEARIAREPVVRSCDYADTPVSQVDEVPGDAAGSGEVRRRHGRDVARHRGAGIHHDEREPAGTQVHELLAGLRRQDDDGAADAGPGRQGGQDRRLLRGFSGVEQQGHAVQLQRLGNGGDDETEVVGQEIGAA
jgi:AcrR family transcriptional regulator